MKKVILAILIIYVTAIPVRACDASRKTIFPGVSWCKGCCDNEGYSWIEVKDRPYLRHRDNAYHAGGFVMLLGLGLVTGLVIVKKKDRLKTKKSAL